MNMIRYTIRYTIYLASCLLLICMIASIWLEFKTQRGIWVIFLSEGVAETTTNPSLHKR